MIGLALLGATAALGASACAAPAPLAQLTAAPSTAAASPVGQPTATPAAADAVLTAAAVAARDLAAQPTATPASAAPDVVETAAAVEAEARAAQPTTVAKEAPTPALATEAPPPPTGTEAPPPPSGAEAPPPPSGAEAPTPLPVAVPTLGVGPDGPLPNPNSVPVPPPGACHVQNGLPDHSCTPGLLNPRLTAAQLCAPGFSTRPIRPPTSYTDVLKQRLMAAYGQTGMNPLSGRPWSANDVELDHDVSLEDLGHPWSPLNLWPEPRRSSGAEPNAEEKDQVETTVHELICADQAHADDYAARLAADWTQFRRGAPATPIRPKGNEP